MAENNKKKKELSFDAKALIATVAVGAGATGVLGMMYYVYLRGLKKQNAEALDKIVESTTKDHETARACDVYLHEFINYICGKSEKVRDALIEEGVIEGEGWDLPLKNDGE